MAKLRVLSGREVCSILEAHGFVRVRIRGSHIVMQRRSDKTTVTVPVPDHSELRSGLCSQSSVKAAYLALNLNNDSWKHRVPPAPLDLRSSVSEFFDGRFIDVLVKDCNQLGGFDN